MNEPLIVIRTDKGDGEQTELEWESAIHRLQDYYRDQAMLGEALRSGAVLQTSIASLSRA